MCFYILIKDARGSSAVLNHRWENIHLNCSVQNALTINYSDYTGLPPDYEIKQISLRPIIQVKVECVSQVCFSQFKINFDVS